jgi:hypothetical protein
LHTDLFWLIMAGSATRLRFAIGRNLMNRFRLCSIMLALGTVLLRTAAAHGQAAAPPSAPAAAARVPAVADVGALSRQFADQVRELGDAITADLGQTPSGPVLLQDARELGQAVTEFSQALRAAPDGLRRRQLYSGVDVSWHRLQGQLGQTRVSAPRVEAAAKRVGDLESQIHTALGLNAFPAIYYGDRTSPGGMREIQRLARSLVDRAEALLAVVRSDIQGPPGTRLADEVSRMVSAADAFHDGIDLGSRIDDVARNGFAGVTVTSDAVAADLAGQRIADRVRAAWQSFRTTETLIRQALKLPVRESDQSTGVVTAAGNTPVPALAERLIRQVDEFLVVFTPEARNVREGGYFIADARRVRGAAAEFREVIPRAIDVGQLAYAFREVDALWEVLARRTNRIAQGESPNVQRIEGIGATVSEIHRLLGMAGIPAVVGPFSG